jgi:transposase
MPAIPDRGLLPDMGRMNGNSQKESALAQWFQARTADGRKVTRKTVIVALARKLLIALWRFVTAGQVPEGVVLRPAF